MITHHDLVHDYVIRVVLVNYFFTQASGLHSIILWVPYVVLIVSALAPLVFSP